MGAWLKEIVRPPRPRLSQLHGLDGAARWHSPRVLGLSLPFLILLPFLLSRRLLLPTLAFSSSQPSFAVKRESALEETHSCSGSLFLTFDPFVCFSSVFPCLARSHPHTGPRGRPSVGHFLNALNIISFDFFSLILPLLCCSSSSPMSLSFFSQVLSLAVKHSDLPLAHSLAHNPSLLFLLVFSTTGQRPASAHPAKSVMSKLLEKHLKRRR